MDNCPPDGWIKIYADASLLVETGEAGASTIAGNAREQSSFRREGIILG